MAGGRTGLEVERFLSEGVEIEFLPCEYQHLSTCCLFSFTLLLFLTFFAFYFRMLIAFAMMI